MEKSPLYIPKAKKWKGLTVYCYKCQTNVSEICKETGKTIQRCPFGDKHAFKVYVHVPGTDNVRKTKKLDTRDVNEAIQQAIQFEKEVKENISSSEINVENKKENSREVANTPQFLIHSLSRYIGWLHNEGVPSHRKKERSNEHIADVERSFKLLVECLKKNKHNVSSLTVDQINDKVVGEMYDYLLNEKGFANRTFNKHFGYYTSFLKWYSEEFDVPVHNWFERVKRKKINPNPETITKDEYEALLKKITPENGKKEYSEGKKPIRNLYRPWLADGIRLGLETGRRREEIISLKFSDIITDISGSSFIKVEDFKVNRIQNRKTETEKKYIFIPVTNSLKQLLDELGHEEYKNSDNFILAPDVKISRTRTMSDVLSSGFSHYYKQLNTGRNLTFKDLRKTYITNLSLYMGGGNAKAITRHSDDAVIEKYYLDKQALVKAAQGFEVFSQNTERKNELDQVRNNSTIKQKNIEVEK